MKKSIKKKATFVGVLAALTLAVSAVPMVSFAATPSPEQSTAKETATVKVNNTPVYNGTLQSPSITVKDSKGNVISSKYYTVTKQKYAGTYRLQVIFKGKYANLGVKSVNWKINKGTTTLTKGTTSKTFKAVSRGYTTKAQSYKINAKYVRTSYTKNDLSLTYTKVSGSKNITVSKSGKVTVAKGTKKGTYKVKVKYYKAGTANYKAASKTVTLTIKVK